MPPTYGECERIIWRTLTIICGQAGRLPPNAPSAMPPRFVVCNSRGNKTAIELFVAGIRGWEADLRRQYDMMQIDSIGFAQPSRSLPDMDSNPTSHGKSDDGILTAQTTI